MPYSLLEVAVIVAKGTQEWHVPIIIVTELACASGCCQKSGKKNIASFFLFELTYCSHILHVITKTYVARFCQRPGELIRKQELFDMILSGVSSVSSSIRLASVTLASFVALSLVLHLP